MIYFLVYVTRSGPFKMHASKTSLITVDLEKILPSNPIKFVDIDSFLEGGAMIKEGVFRAVLRSFDFDSLQGHLVGFSNNKGHILPKWAPILLSFKFSSKNIWTTWADSEKALHRAWMIENLANWDASVFEDKRVSIKGCSDNLISADVYMAYVREIARYAKVLSYGEKCALVPISKETL